METNSYFKAVRGRGTLYVPTAALKKELQTQPDLRPDAVARARKLIAAPGYPPPSARRRLAMHFALKLTVEKGPLLS
jgi:hypothetical protein